jgi:SRSO17 transposase
VSVRVSSRWRPASILKTFSRRVSLSTIWLAKAPWSDETLLQEVLNHVLPTMQTQEPVVAWIVDDTGFLKRARIGWESRVNTADKWGNKITAG